MRLFNNLIRFHRIFLELIPVSINIDQYSNNSLS